MGEPPTCLRHTGSWTGCQWCRPGGARLYPGEWRALQLHQSKGQYCLVSHTSPWTSWPIWSCLAPQRVPLHFEAGRAHRSASRHCNLQKQKLVRTHVSPLSAYAQKLNRPLRSWATSASSHGIKGLGRHSYLGRDSHNRCSQKLFLYAHTNILGLLYTWLPVQPILSLRATWYWGWMHQFLQEAKCLWSKL